MIFWDEEEKRGIHDPCRISYLTRNESFSCQREADKFQIRKNVVGVST